MTPQQLRNSILQQAIEGKLVEQRPEEGTAEELYSEIQEEKKKLISEGKIKKGKSLPEITEDEIPFDIPESWKWVRIGSVINEVIVPQRDKPPFSGNIPWCRIEDREGYLLNGTKSGQYVSEETVKKMNLKICPIGTVLNACSGASIGTILITTVACCTNQTFNGLVCNNLFYNWYLFWYLKSVILKLKSLSTGSAMGYVSQDKMRNMVIPLPPLAEQKRIVAKIEELLPFVDKYEKAYNSLEEYNARFPEDMKKSILQQAIEGKLVEQRPEEGTAEELYSQIQEEKKKLIAEGKIKKEKPLPEITEDEIPFDIPESWKWVRLNEVTFLSGGFAFKSTKYKKEGIRVLRISDFNSKGILDKDIVRYQYNEELEQFKLNKKDIIMCMTGGTVGKNCYIDELYEDTYANQRVCTIRSNKEINSKYIYFVINSNNIQNNIHNSKNSTNDNISMEIIRNFLIPLPPSEEQTRIVSKIEELLPYCEKLK